MSDLINSVNQAEKGVESQLKKIGKNNNLDLVLIVGPTGSGKTSLFYSLLGRSLKVNKSGRHILLEPQNKIEGFDIGHIGSTTKIPNLYPFQSSQIILCDCPGFFDTGGGEQDIPNAFAVDYILSRANHVKILLVLSQYDIDSARNMVLKKATELVENLIPDYQSKIKIFGLVITKDQYEPNPIDFLPSDIDSNEPTLLNFFRDHAKNQIFQFPCPPSGCNIYSDFQDKQKILNFINDLPSAAIQSHGIALSTDSKLLILSKALSNGTVSNILSRFINYIAEEISVDYPDLIGWKTKVDKLLKIDVHSPKIFRSKVGEIVPSQRKYDQIYNDLEKIEPWRQFVLRICSYLGINSQNDHRVKGLCVDIKSHLNEILRPYQILIENAIFTQKQYDQDYQNDITRYNNDWNIRCSQWSTQWYNSGGWQIPHPPHGHPRGPPPPGHPPRGPPPGPWWRRPPPHRRPGGPHGPPGFHRNITDYRPPIPPSYWTSGPPGCPPCGACGQQTKGPGRDTQCPVMTGHQCNPSHCGKVWEVGSKDGPWPPPPPQNGWCGRSPPKKKIVRIRNGQLITQ